MARAELAQRIVVGAVAVAMIVWFAVSVVDMHALASAQTASTGLLRPHLSAAERRAALRRAIADANSAGALRPGDAAPLTMRIYAYAFAGHGRKALKAAKRLVRAEPRNRIGWTAIQALARSSNPRLAAQARARLGELVRDPSRRRR